MSFGVSEAAGRPMTYTVAIVDEGLLGLTNFKTPQLHDHFYQKEALGIATWDLFDEVVGAYGAELERLLALGGGDEVTPGDDGDRRRRFPPVVKFLGPFQLAPGENRLHQLTLPQYVGAVRLMVVAGQDGAYGSTDLSVPVREPISILPTLPRVLGPGEKVALPVSVFVQQPGIDQVALQAKGDMRLKVLSGDRLDIPFSQPGEQLAQLQLETATELGKCRLFLTAQGGGHATEAEVNIDLRSPNPRTLKQYKAVLPAGGSWGEPLKPFGMPGTDETTLEVSLVPPLNLEKHLDQLIQYPHGCVEQVTSGAFPQLYLDQVLGLDDKRREKVSKHIQAAIGRLKGYQVGNGAFAYWPGSDDYNAWANNYVGHFLLEAKRLGYPVPEKTLEDWQGFQNSTANEWQDDGNEASRAAQAYRLYTLALANWSNLGAMNRLRELKGLTSPVRWQLAAAYQMAGQPDAALALVTGDKRNIPNYKAPGLTFGSALRDRAIILDGMFALGRLEEAQHLAEEITQSLGEAKYLNTHELAFTLYALSRQIGQQYGETEFHFRRTLDGQAEELASYTPVYSGRLDLPAGGAAVEIANLNEGNLYLTITQSGVPAPGDEEAAANGLSIGITYQDLEGKPVKPARLPQGQDFVAEVTVRNNTKQTLEHLALTHIFPSGWEIQNARLAGQETLEEGVEYRDQRDDRLLTYFALKAGQVAPFRARLNATYQGRFYLPTVNVEAMYQPAIHARTKGQWVEVVAE
jgi:alpha-2-macroglobulin